jgi:sulfatase modifying factor 1
MKKCITLSCLVVAVATLTTNQVFAGGGGTGSKATGVVRIKNTAATGSSAPLIALDSVEVGDPGNAATTVDGTDYGAVAQTYRITKTEITIAQYTTFLNAIARRSDGAQGSVVESLYDSRMATDPHVAGISRAGSGTEAVPYTYTAIGDPSKPIAYVSWFNAARFANWLHNGATQTADTETGAYTLSGALSGIITKNPTASWWIPSEDEWWKAAYYKGNGVNAGYWRYPTQSDSFPSNNSSTDANNANFLRLGLYAITQMATLDTAQNYLSAAATSTNSPSAYGTFDQGGNLDEALKETPEPQIQRS